MLVSRTASVSDTHAMQVSTACNQHDAVCTQTIIAHTLNVGLYYYPRAWNEVYILVQQSDDDSDMKHIQIDNVRAVDELEECPWNT